MKLLVVFYDLLVETLLFLPPLPLLFPTFAKSLQGYFDHADD